MTPITAGPDYARWTEVLALVQNAFAYMEARTGHPSPAARLTPKRLVEDAALGPVFLIEAAQQPIACLFCRPSRDVKGAMYIGRLAIAETYRSKGLARILVDAAEDAARTDNAHALTLDTSVMLTELHDIFQTFGFEIVETDQATGVVTMVKLLAEP